MCMLFNHVPVVSCNTSDALHPVNTIRRRGVLYVHTLFASKSLRELRKTEEKQNEGRQSKYWHQTTPCYCLRSLCALMVLKCAPTAKRQLTYLINTRGSTIYTIRSNSKRNLWLAYNKSRLCVYLVKKNSISVQVIYLVICSASSMHVKRNRQKSALIKKFCTHAFNHVKEIFNVLPF